MTGRVSSMTKLDIVAEPGKPTIVMTRAFDAPRALVFEALTNPKHVPSWWGPRSHTTKVITAEPRPGGAWRFISHDEHGNEFAFRGVCRELVAPERYAYTFEYEGMPGYISLEVITLDERGGRTTLTNTAYFHTVEDRDGMVATGMESGATDSMDRLEELLATLM
jgi:uncharacterized protein YndB with AHSA1/START domain